MKRLSLLFFSLISLMFAFCVSASAQSNGNVKGVVKDASGAVLPGAQITLTNKSTQRAQQVLTNETGSYIFSFVPPGDYSAAFEMQGFRKLTIDNITVNVAQTVLADASLQIGDLSSELTVNRVSLRVSRTPVRSDATVSTSPPTARDLSKIA